MVKVSLRVYNREIESMVEAGQLEEAVAHCQHILKTFPMHIETYRLLGKSFLEARHYTDAADIFQRVLMAVPDDFVANVGMSIIRDDESKLDDAIWHMERAFESQPSNPAIQGELRRLYGRRDGVEPPKIRLSRDALANMYAQGELFNQAIAEIRAVLAEDPNRSDLQVMLARAYYRSGQKVEAAEMAANLLKKYTYCLDAIRILVDVLPGSARAENTQVYRQRLYMLDPYSSFVTGSMFNTDQVADAAVDLERLEYTASSSPTLLRPNWVSSLGIKLTGEKHIDPALDLMNTAGSENSFTQAAPESTSSRIVPEGDEISIPDWMQSSDWQGTNKKATEEPIGVSSDRPAEQTNQADIPDWLSAMAPQGISDAIENSTSAMDNQIPSASGETPYWLQAITPQESNTGSINGTINPPSFGEGQTPETPVEPGSTAIQAIQAPSEHSVSAMDIDSFPDWIKDMEDSSAGISVAETNVRLDQTEVDVSPASTEPAPNLPITEIPIEPPFPGFPAEAETKPQTIGESKPLSKEDETSAWMDEFTAKLSEKENELLTNPKDNLVGKPDWLQSPEVEKVSTPTSEPHFGSSEAIPMEPVANLPEVNAELEAAKIEELTPVAASADRSTKPLAFEDEIKGPLEGLGNPQIEKEDLAHTAEDYLIGMPDWLRSAEELPISSTVPEEPSLPIDPVALEPVDMITEEPVIRGSTPIANKQIDHDDRVDDKPDWLRSAEGQPLSPITSEMHQVQNYSIPSELVIPPGDGSLSEPPNSPDVLPVNTEDHIDDKPDWMHSIEQLPTVHTQTEPSSTTGETKPLQPERQLLENIINLESVPNEEPDLIAPSVDVSDQRPNVENETLAWLEGLAGKEGNQEGDHEIKPVEMMDDKPDWLHPFEERPDSSTPLEPFLEAFEPPSLKGILPTTEEVKVKESTAVENGSPSIVPSEGITETNFKINTLDRLEEAENEDESKLEAFTADRLENSESPDALTQDEKELISSTEIPAPESLQDDITITSWLSKKDVEEAVRKSRSKSDEPQPAASVTNDLPDWLKGLEEPVVPQEEEKSVETLPEWLRQPAQPTDQIPAGIPTPDSTAEQELPVWIDEEIPLSVDSIPTTPGEWVPVEEKTTEFAEIGSIPEEEFAVESSLLPRFPKPTGILAAIPTKDKDAELLTRAQTLLDDDQLNQAMQAYTLLIKKNRLLDEVIHDLREAIYRYPVDIIVWQTLGDASIRANRLQDALDAYTKAEELLR
jgi:tetratricopeptide (TPR) repeat protein